MSFDYKAKQATAKRLLVKFGQSASFIVKGSTGGRDDFGDVIPAQPDVVIAGTVSPKVDYKANEVNGETIQMGDAKVSFQADNTMQAVPVGALIDLNGSAWRVVMDGGIDSVDNIKVFQKLTIRRN